MFKKKLTIITILSLAVLTGSYFVAAHYGYFSGGTNAPSVPEDTMTRGLVGYWSFDEGTGQTVYDRSGNSNNGTLGASSAVGSDDPLWTSDGKSMGGMKFDGTNDRVSVADSVSLKPDEITISVWVKKTSLQTTTTSILGKVTASNDDYRMRINNSGIFNVGYNATVSLTSLGSPAFNEWNHLVFTGDSSGGTLYLNGVFDNSNSTAFITPDNSGIFYIGYSLYGTYFPGLIDEVRIYNRALTADEVRYHYNRGGPVGYWNFNEGSGVTAYDSTENDNDGTIYGAAGTADSGTTTTLTDTKSWTADEWIGETVTIHTGTCSPVSRTVTDNDATSITVADWDSCTPDTTSEYKITSKNEWTMGKLGSAIDFDGVDDYVDAGNSEIFQFGTGDFAIATWLKVLSDPPDNEAFIQKRTNVDLGYEIGVSSMRQIYGTAAVKFTAGPTSETLNLSQWYHIVIIRNSGITYLYLDGIQLYSRANIISASSANNLYFAKDFLNVRYGNYILDDVRIYDYARNADEIRLDYNAGLATHLGPSGKTCLEDPASCTDYGLVGSWNMDEGTGTTAYDSSENGNDGTLTGGPKWTTLTPLLSGGGSALRFDGVDDYADVSNTNSLDVANVTLAAWVKSDTVGRYIIAKDPPLIDLKIQETNYKQITNKFKIQNSSGQNVFRQGFNFVKQKIVGFVNDGKKNMLSLFGSENNSQNSSDDLVVENSVRDNKETPKKISYNTNVSSLKDGKQKYKIHVGHINYKDKESEQFEKIDTTLLLSDYGWKMNKASYHLEIPKYADGWFNFVNDFKDENYKDIFKEGLDNKETVAMKPLGVSRVKGELIEFDENGWNKKKILYRNAFGNNIDLEVVAKNIGFDKLIVINEKPEDLSNDLEFSFEIDLDDYVVKYRDGQEWDKQGSTESDQPFILEKLKQTWFREFSVWDSGGNRGRIRVRLEKDGGKHIFTKILDKEFLENAVYPVYTDDIVSYYAGAGDGQNCTYNSGSWDLAHDAASGDYVYPTSTACYLDNEDDKVYRQFFPTDTSAIDNSAIIESALFYIYIGSSNIGDNDGDDFLVILQTSQASTDTLTVADFNQCGAIDNPIEGSDRIDLSSDITKYSYNEMNLNSTGISWINKAGITMLGLREGHDVLDNPIEAGKMNSIKLYFSENTGIDKDPYLEVITAKTDVPYAISTVAGGQFLIMNNSTTYTATATTDINDNEWHYVVGSYDGTTMKIYIDGNLEDTNTDFSGNLPIVDGNVRVGADYQSVPDSFFSGLIDEACIYNRALSVEEIRYLYNKGEPVAQWNFDEGSGQKVYDSVGNADGELGSTSGADANDPGWSVP